MTVRSLEPGPGVEMERGADAGEPAGLGARMHALVAELYPICRSITGNGVRETLRRISEEIPLRTVEVPSGTRVFDWEVPAEWNIRDAYVMNARGERVVDFGESNLHVMGYSAAVDREMSLAELRPHLHTVPGRPGWIPYRTSYYSDGWGFCLSQDRLDSLEEGPYRVRIDATLAPGALTYGECLLPGDSEETILLSCHICHPSLCNDNLSGIAVAVQLAAILGSRRRRYSYRFVFAPSTIGSIAWLARNEPALPSIRYGLVLACVGDPGGFTYKRSRRGDAPIDRVMEYVLERSGRAGRIVDFSPFGYDERQYCSPGIDLPLGCLMRTPHGEFPEYHTSADDLNFVRAEALEGSLALCLEAIEIIERDGTFVNENPKGEPQLGRRGLYGGLAGRSALPSLELALLWVLNLSDGRHSLLDIAVRSGIGFDVVASAAETLIAHGLLAEAA